jgi:hypothetical protein
MPAIFLSKEDQVEQEDMDMHLANSSQRYIGDIISSPPARSELISKIFNSRLKFVRLNARPQKLKQTISKPTIASQFQRKEGQDQGGQL